MSIQASVNSALGALGAGRWLQRRSPEAQYKEIKKVEQLKAADEEQAAFEKEAAAREAGKDAYTQAMEESEWEAVERKDMIVQMAEQGAYNKTNRVPGELYAEYPKITHFGRPPRTMRTAQDIVRQHNRGFDEQMKWIDALLEDVKQEDLLKKGGV